MSGRTIAALASGWSHQTAKIGNDLGAQIVLLESQNHADHSSEGYPIVPTGRQARAGIFVSLRRKEGRP
jgi:hypothetical protein